MIEDIEPNNEGTSEFSIAITKAIDIFSKGEDIDSKEIIKEIESCGVNYKEAVDIFLFTPMVFTHLMLPSVKWSDWFVDWIDENTQVRLKLSETSSYQQVLRTVKEYLKNGRHSSIILKVASRSAEFQAINELLNKGEKLDDMRLTDAVLIRK